MAAEASNEIGDTADAILKLNTVRNRVGLYLHQIDVTQPPWNSLSTSQNSIRELIYRERRSELSCEGHRFFDLVRTGKAAEKINGFVVGKHELFPIPQDEIDLAGGNWSQNPGY